MYIKLNILDGTCAQIYADAEEGEEPYVLEGKSSSHVKIWHNDHESSMHSVLCSVQNADNDNYLTFSSKIPFKDFCKKFIDSGYNEANNYHLLNHNCANAAQVALKIAGIDLPISKIKLTQIIPYSIYRIPSFTLTPLDLYKIARKYKVEKLHHQPHKSVSWAFKMELAATSLLFKAKPEKADTKEKIQTILSETNRLIKTREHHTELYLQALIKTIDLLQLKKEFKENQEYAGLANSLREREVVVQPVLKAVEQYFGVIMSIYALNVSCYLIKHFESTWKFCISLFFHMFIYSNDPQMNLPFSCLMAAATLNLWQTLRTAPKPKHHGLFETTLSKTMKDLALECNPTVTKNSIPSA